MDEAKRLVESGVQEILIVSQDTSAYGKDQGNCTNFWNGMPVKQDITSLAHILGKMGVWIRLHYVYPYPWVDDLIPLMAERLILPYLDIPLQHASPRILKMMKRPGRIDRQLESLIRWREICPDLVIRSTFIVGFPGETEEDFEILLNFLRQAKLDRVGCFKYSEVEGAVANDLAELICEEIKEDRHQRFMEVQAEISAERLARFIGRTLDILIDDVDKEGAIGRSFADAPEIDGMVFINDETELESGMLVRAKITHTDEHDMWAKLINLEE